MNLLWGLNSLDLLFDAYLFSSLSKKPSPFFSEKGGHNVLFCAAAATSRRKCAVQSGRAGHGGCALPPPGPRKSPGAFRAGGPLG